MRPFKFIRDKEGDIQYITTNLWGRQLLKEAALNKDNAFTDQERETFELLGQLPSCAETLEQQLKRFYQQYQEQNSDLEKNTYLTHLYEQNETAFFRLASDHLEEMLPVIYTPTIGEVIQKFSEGFRQYRGVFVSYPDKNQIDKLFEPYDASEFDIAIVTDGERILGIGDQGVGGIKICMGKSFVYTLCAGINPHRILPIQLDVGTNNKRLLDNPLYLGWRHERISGQDYDDFIDAFITVIQKRFPHILLHWEDFGRDNARRNLERYQNQLCTFNDDMQGTGAVTLASILSATQAIGKKISDQQVVILGAGTAGTGIADQICNLMILHGLSEQAARNQIWLIGRDGLLLDSSETIRNFQRPYLKSQKSIFQWTLQNSQTVSLLDVIKNLHPDILIGCSTAPGSFTEEMIRTMSRYKEHPIILPLSNPTSKAEAVPNDLIRWTQGKAVIATGSPFSPVECEGRKILISQCNNAFIFPGLSLGTIAVRAKHITDNMLRAASFALTDLSPLKKDKMGSVLPSLLDIGKISHQVAVAVAKQAIQDGVAEEVDIEKAIRTLIWKPKYYPYQRLP